MSYIHFTTPPFVSPSLNEVSYVTTQPTEDRLLYTRRLDKRTGAGPSHGHRRRGALSLDGVLVVEAHASTTVSGIPLTHRSPTLSGPSGTRGGSTRSSGGFPSPVGIDSEIPVLRRLPGP